MVRFSKHGHGESDAGLFTGAVFICPPRRGFFQQGLEAGHPNLRQRQLQPHPPMKHTLRMLCLGLFSAMLSQCTTYVDGRGPGSRPGYVYRSPASYAHPWFYSSAPRHYNHPRHSGYHRSQPVRHDDDDRKHWKKRHRDARVNVQTGWPRVSSSNWLRF